MTLLDQGKLKMVTILIGSQNKTQQDPQFLVWPRQKRILSDHSFRAFHHCFAGGMMMNYCIFVHVFKI